MQLGTDWTTVKAFAMARSIGVQYIATPDTYYIWAIDGQAELATQITIASPSTGDQLDFETNFMPMANQPLLPLITTVTTQFEKTNKILKLACGTAPVNSSGTAVVAVKIPGTFGSGQGRYVIGGYGISADYNFGDTVTCRVEDTDRIIALMVAQAITPGATTPVSDATIQGMGVIAGIGQAFPNYPIVQSYTDDEMTSVNQGWFFWPLNNGSSVPVGEVEINPLGGYGFVPAGFYIVVTYQRPSGITIGAININFDWGEAT